MRKGTQVSWKYGTGTATGKIESVHKEHISRKIKGSEITRNGTADDPAQPVEERNARAEWAAKLSFPALHRLWQLFLKGHDEVAKAALPIEAAEMALLRAIHASTLPDPGELAKQIASGKLGALTAPAAAAPAASAAPVAAERPGAPADFPGLVAMLEDKGHFAVAAQLSHGARVVRYEAPELVLSGSRPMSADTLRDVAEALKAATGQVWKIVLEDAPGAPTLREKAKADEEATRQAILATPLVRAAFAAFPEAELEAWPGKRSNA